MEHLKLVENAIKGDKNAMLTLFKEESARLYRTAYLYTKNKNDSLDILQETILKALKSIHKLNDPRFFSTWITKILINTSFDHIRESKKILTVDFEFKISEPSKNLEDSLDLYNAIDKLNSKHRIIIILRFFQDKSIKEIAQILELPEGTIKSNLHRALKHLKVSLKEDDCING